MTGTQRLILAEELTSIRAGQMQKANYLTASTVFSRRTPESCINKTNYNTHTHKIVKLNLCLQANKKEPERVYVTVPSTDASHNNIGRIPNYSNKINKWSWESWKDYSLMFKGRRWLLINLTKEKASPTDRLVIPQMLDFSSVQSVGPGNSWKENVALEEQLTITLSASSHISILCLAEHFIL